MTLLDPRKLDNLTLEPLWESSSKSGATFPGCKAITVGYSTRPKVPHLKAHRIIVAFVGLVALVFPTSVVNAQDGPSVELTGGVILLRNSDIVEGIGSGWMAGTDWQVTDRLSLTLEASGVSSTQTITFLEIDAQFLTMLAGPTFKWKVGPVKLFGRVLFGATQMDLALKSDFPGPSTGENKELNSTVQFGSGVVLPLKDKLAARFSYHFQRILAADHFHQHGITLSAVYGIGGS